MTRVSIGSWIAVVPQPPGVALQTYSTDAEQPFLWADLGSLFGLTRAEAGIVKRVISGDRAEAMAKDLGVTVKTMRTYTRRTDLKLGGAQSRSIVLTDQPLRVR